MWRPTAFGMVVVGVVFCAFRHLVSVLFRTCLFAHQVGQADARVVVLWLLCRVPTCGISQRDIGQQSRSSIVVTVVAFLPLVVRLVVFVMEVTG